MSEPLPAKLEYQIAPRLERRRAPAWVWTIIGVYLLMWLAVLLTPAWVALAGSDHDLIVFASVAVIVTVVSALALLLTPVRLVRDRPLSRRSYVVPLLVSGLLFGLLIVGVITAIFELSAGEQFGENYLWAAILGGCLAWAGWAVVWWIASSSRDPLSLAGRLHRLLLLGSVAELLVAVPSHVIVRRRNECCAGLWTGTAICLGALVMFIAFGASVLLLYYRRARQIKPPPVSLSPEGRGQG